MGRLENRKPQGFDFLENAVAGMTAEVTRQLAPQLQALNKNTEMLIPMVANAIKQSLSELAPAIQQIASLQQANTQQTSILGEAQNALVQALGQIQIPDYSNTLSRIEENRVDLTGIEGQIEALALQIDTIYEEKPREWRFDIKRDADGNLDSIDAMAVEDDE